MKPARQPIAAASTEEIAARASAAGRLGIDTEFVSEGRYRPLLCLVQVAVPRADHSGAVDIDVLDTIEGVDPGPLADVLADELVEVVMHAGAQDVTILRRAWGVELRNVFDTQIAAGFAGFSAQAGYGNLLSAALKIRLHKSAGFTRWDERPLTREQLDYARSDVKDVLALADELQRRLAESGRLEWAREECRRLEGLTDERDPEEAWRRLPRVNQLRPRARAVAREVAAWRERTAASEDRPLGSILSDVAVVEIARRQPRDAEALMRIRGVRRDVGRRRGRAIVEAVARGQSADPIPAEDRVRVDVRPTHAPAIALAEAVIRARALEAGLAYELVASRGDLTEIVVAARQGDPEPEVRTLTGWRRDLAGAEILELLSGRRSVAVGDDGELEVRPSDG